MTPLEQELDNLKRRCEQQIRMDIDEMKQAEQLIAVCRQRIEHNKKLLKELKQHEEVYRRREVPADRTREEG